MRQLFGVASAPDEKQIGIKAEKAIEKFSILFAL
jgi:hypothetical protein